MRGQCIAVFTVAGVALAACSGHSQTARRARPASSSPATASSSLAPSPQPSVTIAASEPLALAVLPPAVWSTGRLTDVHVLVDAAADARVSGVELHAEREAAFVAPQTGATAEVGRDGRTLRFTFRVRVSARSSGRLQATAHVAMFGHHVETLRRTLFFAAESGAVLSSAAGPSDLGMAVAARQRPGETAAVFRASAEKARFGGDRVAAAVTGRSHHPKLRVSGVVRYEASNGSLHPARQAAVELVDSVGAVVGSLGRVDDSGAFGAAVHATAASTCAACRVRVLASYGGVTVSDESSHAVWGIDTGFLDLRGASSVRISLIANRVADNNTALAVGDALVTAVRAARRLFAGFRVDLPVLFPTSRLASCFNPDNDKTLHLLRADRFDWDVIEHEFGHYLEAREGLTAGVEGSHIVGQGQAVAHGRADGEALAWSEGFATFFAVLAQRETNARRLHIPYVGDYSYTDTEDMSPPLSYSLARESGAFVGRGPDDELTVQRTLFALVTGDSSSGWVRLPAQRLVSDLVSARAKTLRAALDGLVAHEVPGGRCLPDRDGPVTASIAGCALAVAAGCVAAARGTGPTWAPEYGSAQGDAWTAGPAAPENLTAFRVVVYSGDWRRLLLATRLSGSRTWKPDRAMAASLRRNAHAVVFGWQHGADAGRFNSCPLARPFGRRS